MKRFSKLLCFMVVFISVIAAFCTVSFAADIGKELTSPENGWQRYDSTDPSITYTGGTSYWVKWTNGNAYGGSLYTQDSESAITNPYSFKFYGTKLRLIGLMQPNSAIATITIDGTAYDYSLNTGSTTYIALMFEKLDLPLGVHNVSVKKKSGMYYNIDAIDIDDTGYLIGGNQPTNFRASEGISKIDLSWDSVTNATSYNVKRATTAGGPYTTIATTSEITYTDTNILNGTTYYYVVSAVVNGVESSNSNKASVTTTSQQTNQLKLVLEVNQEKQLSVSEELSGNTEIDWTSSDSAIATVDVNGKVKASKPGNTVITCTSKDNSYTEKINVLVVDLDYQLAVDLEVGGICRLTIDDLTNTTSVTWSSYNTTIATVSAKGKVTAVSEGLTYIVATDKDGKEIGRIYIRVRQ